MVVDRIAPGMDAHVKKETAGIIQILSVALLGAAAIMVVKRRSESDDEEVGGVDASTEKYLKGLPDDELERLIIEARKGVYEAKVDVGDYRSNRLVKFDETSGAFVDCEGGRVAGVVEVKPATERDAEEFRECEEDVAREKE